MNIRLKVCTKLVWNCLSNTQFHNSICFQSTKTNIIQLCQVPHVHEQIEWENSIYSIENVVHYPIEDNHSISAELVISKFIYVDFYDYMKFFTHCYDNYKDKDDITKISSSNIYIINLPTTIEEWLEDIEILKLKDTFTNEEKLYYANRRCIKK